MKTEHEPWREQLGAYVLGHLPEEERAALEEHIRRCPFCSTEARELVDVVKVLPTADPDHLRMARKPPPELEERVFRRLGEVRRTAELARRRRMVLAAGIGLAAAAAVAIGVLLLRSNRAPQEPRQAQATVTFSAVPSGAEVTATAFAASEGTEIRLRVRNLPPGQYVIALLDANGRVFRADPFNAPKGNWGGRRDYPLSLRETTEVTLTLVRGDFVLRGTVS